MFVGLPGNCGLTLRRGPEAMAGCSEPERKCALSALCLPSEVCWMCDCAEPQWLRTQCG